MRFVEVCAEIAGDIKKMAKAKELHLHRDRANGFGSHHARHASLHQERCGHISKTELYMDLQTYHTGNRAKHVNHLDGPSGFPVVRTASARPTNEGMGAELKLLLGKVQLAFEHLQRLHAKVQGIEDHVTSEFYSAELDKAGIGGYVCGTQITIDTAVHVRSSEQTSAQTSHRRWVDLEADDDVTDAGAGTNVFIGSDAESVCEIDTNFDSRPDIKDAEANRPPMSCIEADVDNQAEHDTNSSSHSAHSHVSCDLIQGAEVDAKSASNSFKSAHVADLDQRLDGSEHTAFMQVPDTTGTFAEHANIVEACRARVSHSQEQSGPKSSSFGCSPFQEAVPAKPEQSSQLIDIQAEVQTFLDDHKCIDVHDMCFGKLFMRSLAEGLKNPHHRGAVCLLLEQLFERCPKHFMITSDLNQKFSIVGWREFQLTP